MKQYDVSNPEDMGRFALMVSQMIGRDVEFVFSYLKGDKDEDKYGLLTNIPPEKAIHVIGVTARKLLGDNEYEEVTISEH